MKADEARFNDAALKLASIPEVGLEARTIFLSLEPPTDPSMEAPNIDASSPAEIQRRLCAHPDVADASVCVMGNRVRALVVPDPRTCATLHRLMACHKRGGTENQRFAGLPNGVLIAERSASETQFLYDEIFLRDVYFRNGITLPDEPCVIDAGSNIGMFIVKAATQARGGRYYAFEFIPQVCDVLAINMELHDVAPSPFALGLGSTECTASLTFFPHNSILSTSHGEAQGYRAIVCALVRSDEGSAALPDFIIEDLVATVLEGHPVTSRITTISSVIADHQIESIDLLKIDVERAELEVLRGISARDWHKIQQVVAEVDGSDDPERLGEVTNLLTQRGFSVTVEADASLGDFGLANVYATRGMTTSAANTRQDKWQIPAALRDELYTFLRTTSTDMPVEIRFVPSIDACDAGAKEPLPDVRIVAHETATKEI